MYYMIMVAIILAILTVLVSIFVYFDKPFHKQEQKKDNQKAWEDDQPTLYPWHSSIVLPQGAAIYAPTLVLYT